MIRSYSLALNAGWLEFPPSGSGRLLSVRIFLSALSLLEDLAHLLPLLCSFTVSHLPPSLPSAECVESVSVAPAAPAVPAAAAAAEGEAEEAAGRGELSLDLGLTFFFLPFLLPFFLALAPSGPAVLAGGAADSSAAGSTRDPCDSSCDSDSVEADSCESCDRSAPRQSEANSSTGRDDSRAFPPPPTTNTPPLSRRGSPPLPGGVVKARELVGVDARGGVSARG